MRADARHNAAKLRVAAARLFQERGLQVSLKEIARTAGVSPGTLYNLFGNREKLIDEVVADLAGARLDAVAAQALAHEDPWEGFVFYIEKVCELQATDRALNDVLARRYPDAARLMAVCDRVQATAGRVIERARHSGTLRSDFTREDLLFIFATNARLAQAAAHTAPDAWRRCVAFVLDGLRTEAGRPLPAGPLTPQQATQVLATMATMQ